MRISPKIILGLVAGMLLTACSDDASGPVESQTREVGTFTAIDMDGAADLEITVGEGPAVEVEAPKQLLEHIRTEVRGETLYIEGKAKDWLFAKSGGGTHVRVSVPTLSTLRIDGGNDVSVRGFAGGESSIKAEGAVNIKAEGELDRLTIRMAGAGNGDFSRLVANDARVTMDGVGSVVVHPKEKLDATMNGVGVIQYMGTPREVRTHMNGLGHIGKVEEGGSANASDEEVEIDPDALQPQDEGEKPMSAGEVI